MTRRLATARVRPVYLSLTLLATLVAVEATAPKLAAQPQPNILIVVADDLGTDRLCRYRDDCLDPDDPPAGVASTPNLDTMMANGVHFGDAWANPVCSTTRSTVLTGQYSRRTAILAALGAGQVGLEGDDWTIPEMLAEAADCSGDDPPIGCPPGLDIPRYQTAAFGKWHLNGEAAQDPDGPGPLTGEAGPVVFGGFDHFEGTPANLGRNTDQDLPFIEDYCSSKWWTVRREAGGITQEGPHEIFEYATSYTIDRSIAWLTDRLGSPDPWLVYVAFHAPHTPLHHVDPLGDTFTCGTACLDPGNETENLECWLEMVEAMDTELGRLLQQLGQWASDDLTDFPTVLFLGDNGTESLVIDTAVYPPVDGKHHAKTTVYQGGVRVPLLAAGGRVTAGGRVDSPVNTSDLFMTVAELAGFTDLDLVRQLPSGQARELDSFSFVPHLADVPCGAALNPCRDALFAEIRGSGSQRCEPPGNCQVERPATDALAIRIAEHRNFKLIRGCLPCGAPQTPMEEAGCAEIDCAEGECFYNLALDPTEEMDMLRFGEPPAGSRPDIALQALRQALDDELTLNQGCTLDGRGCPVVCPGGGGGG